MHPGHDGAGYWYAANSFANGEGLRNFFGNEITARIAPGWPLLLSAVIFVFGSNLLAAKALNIVIGSITAILVYFLGTQLRDRRTGIVAGGLMAVFPSQVYFTTTMMNETLFVALSTTLVLLITLWLAKAGSLHVWQALALGLVLGAMSLVRAESILLAPVAVVLFKLLKTPWPDALRYTTFVIVGMAVLITPWTVRNYVRFDEFILIRRASANGTLAPIRAGLSPDFVVVSDAGGVPPSFSDSYDFYRDDPMEIPKQALRKLDRFYGSDDHFKYFIEPDVVNRTSVPALSSDAESRWAALGNAFYYVVAVAALSGLLFWLVRPDRGLLIILWFTSSWSLIFLATVPLTRYHFAIIPMFALLGAVGFIETWDWLAKRLEMSHRARGSEATTP